MTPEARATAFVTDAGSLLGTELITVLVNAGHQVTGLAESAAAAQRVRRAGATAVIGNLQTSGQWQDEASTDWVFRLPPSPLGARLTRRRIESIAAARVAADTRLFDAVASTAKRVVYVGDASCYGATTERPITEDAPFGSPGRGRCLLPALDQVDGYTAAGWPIVTAFPGWVFGNGGWFRQYIVDAVMADRRVLQFGAHTAWVSPIHVRDCARALVHLAERGEAGSRYFLVNNDPIRRREFAEGFARLANRRLRVFRVPAAALRLALGTALGEDLARDAVYSNIRLRGIGFRFLYPTFDEGLHQILGALDE
jgi:nucleoside-diphosphate-sugar epimerase